MKLRIAIEAAILVIFVATALVVVLWYSGTVPADADSGGNARECVQEGDRLYAAGRLRSNAAAVKYWEALRRNPNMADALFKIARIYHDNGWNHEPLHELNKVESLEPDYPGLHVFMPLDQ